MASLRSRPASGRPARRFPALAGALALIALTAIAYVPALRGGFVWDDDAYVTANRALRTANGLADIWLRPGATPQYYPLTFTSFWLEWRLWGTWAAGYHATNVALHAAAAVVLWRLFVLLAVPGAWLGAALFALHPVQVESVAWITERKNVLSGVFALGAAFAFLRAPRAYGLALVLFAAALAAKTVTCTLPVALAVLLWWRHGRLRREDVAPLVPFLGLGVVFAPVTVWMERTHVGAQGALWDLSPAGRVLVAGRALWFYAGTLVWPARLTFVYPRWHVDAGDPSQYVFPLAALLVLAALWTARRRLGTGPLVAALVFAVTLAPALGFVDVYPMRYSFVADHFQYHAAIAPLALAAAAITTRVADRRTCDALAVALLAVLGLLTWRQGWVYRDLPTLWEDTLAKNPGAQMAHVNLGMYWYGQGRSERAVDHFRAALRLDPHDAEVADDLGMALAAAGRSDEALAALRDAARLDPRDPKTHSNLGNVLAARGMTDDAIAEYGEALRLDPRYPDAHNNLANVLAQAGRVDDAIAHYRAAVRGDPNFLEAHRNLGVLLAERGQFAAAVAEQETALRIRPDDPSAHNEAASALAALGRPRDAVVHYREALRLRPEWPEALGRLAALLVDGDGVAARPAEAVQLAERACALTRNADPGLLDVLAAAYAAAGRYGDAVPAARRAIDVATAAGHDDVARDIERRLAAYEAGRPR